MLQDSEATLSAMHQLQTLGVRMSLDDFGTGYSSLSYLRKFPFQKIKVDGSFVRDLESDDSAIAIVRAVASMGANLGMAHCRGRRRDDGAARARAARGLQ